jgi:hypothetical protein
MTIPALVVRVQLRVAVCVLATVVFHSGRWGCLYRFGQVSADKLDIYSCSLLMKIVSFQNKFLLLHVAIFFRNGGILSL